MKYINGFGKLQKNKIKINYWKYHNIGLCGENNVLVKFFNLLRVEFVYMSVNVRACN